MALFLLTTCVLSLASAPARPVEPFPLQSPEAPADVSAQDAADDARPRKRLLHLTGGSILRASTRRIDGRWEYQSGRDWIALPEASVTRAELESDVVQEARRLAAGIGRNAHDARVEHARWLAERGLYAECLEALDRVLTAEPDHAAALAFLAERPVSVGRLEASTAEARASFLERAAHMGPSGRELAVSELGRSVGLEPSGRGPSAGRDSRRSDPRDSAAHDEPDTAADARVALCAELAAQLVARNSARRELAVLALRRLFAGREVLPLARRAVLDPVADVRAAASLALRDAQNPEVAVPVLSALGSSHSLVRKNAAEALGVMGYPLAVEPLVGTLQSTSGYRPPASHIFVGRQFAYVQDFDVEVAQFEGIADPQVNVLTEGNVLDARLISTTSIEIAAERGAVRGALERLTGAKVPSTQNAWQKWWDENGAGFRRANDLVPPAQTE